jgi:hypothetical protein
VDKPDMVNSCGKRNWDHRVWDETEIFEIQSVDACHAWSRPKETAADWTVSAKALPRLSSDKWHSASALRTVAERPDLFKIVSPIDVSVLECLTITHPNLVLESPVKSGFMPSGALTGTVTG